MKRVFSIFFVLVFLLLPLRVSAGSYEGSYSSYNINDLIYIRVSNEWKPFDYGADDSMRFLQSPFSSWNLNSLEFFLAMCLVNFGYDYKDDSIFRAVYFQNWYDSLSAEAYSLESSVQILFEQYYYGMENFSLGVSSRPLIAFSSEFVSIFNPLIQFYFDVNELDSSLLIDPLVSTAQPNGSWWEYTASSYVFFSKVEFTGSAYQLQPYHGVFSLSGKHQLTDDYQLNGLSQIWDSIVGYLDVQKFVSWLPDVISAPIVLYWGIFISLCVSLILLKVKG